MRRSDLTVAVDHPGERSSSRRRRRRWPVWRTRLPYPAEWRTERSRTASTEAAASRARCRRSASRSAHRPGPRAGRTGSRARGPEAAEDEAPRNWGRWIALGLASCPRPRASSGASRATSPCAAASKAANKRLPASAKARARAAERAAALAPERRSCCSAPTTPRTIACRRAERSDSIMLVRTDPGKGHRITTSRSRATSASTIPGPRLRQDQLRVPDRRAGARDQDRARLHGRRGQPRRDRRLRRLHEGDRQGRRRRHRRPGADPLEQVRLPLRDPGALRPLAGLALREGHAAHGRASRAASTRGSARTS